VNAIVEYAEQERNDSELKVLNNCIEDEEGLLTFTACVICIFRRLGNTLVDGVFALPQKLFSE